jgi:hypothetical protein
MKLEKSIEQVRVAAAEFKNLQDRFRVAALVSSQKPFDQFEAEVKPLVRRLEDARKLGITPFEICFTFARRKVKAGHYRFDLDELEHEPVEKQPHDRAPLVAREGGEAA